MPRQLDCYKDWTALSGGDSWMWLTHSSCKNKPRHHPEQTFILLCPATSLHTHKWCLPYSHNDDQIPKRINPDGSVPWFRQLHFSSCLQPAWTPRSHCHGHPLSLTNVDHAMSSNRAALLALDWVLQFPLSVTRQWPNRLFHRCSVLPPDLLEERRRCD